MMSDTVLMLMLLVCSSALWVTNSSNVDAPECNSMLEIPFKDSSLSEGNGDIHSRSLSPWNWRSSTVPDRIPTTLWEAECSSSSCSVPNSGQNAGHDLTSLPIYQNMVVLNRQEGTRCYVASYQLVAVGCTCVRAAQREEV